MPEEFGTIKPVTEEQLELFANDVKDAEFSSDGQALSYAEIKEREHAARVSLKRELDGEELPSWADTYTRLLNRGVPWKIAVYVAWAALPKEMREPKTQDELAQQYLGLNSDRQIAEWRKNYPIDTMIAHLQGDDFFEGRAGVLSTVSYMARQRDYKNAKYADMYLTMTGDLVRTSKVEKFLREHGFSEDDLKGKPIDELRKMRKQLLKEMKEKEELDNYDEKQTD